MTFYWSTRGVAASFLARKLVDCCLMRRYLSACLFVQLPFFIRLPAMFGPWAQNGYLLASILPLGSKFFYFYPLAHHVWALGSERLSSCIDSASRQYIFIFYPLARHVWALGSERLSARVDSIPSALRPRPLMAIFLWPCGLAPSRRKRCYITSRRMSI